MEFLGIILVIALILFPFLRQAVQDRKKEEEFKKKALEKRFREKISPKETFATPRKSEPLDMQILSSKEPKAVQNEKPRCKMKKIKDAIIISEIIRPYDQF